MIELQDALGILFVHKREVASLTPEFRNRWRAVLSDGSVAHRPTPPPPGPWVGLGESLVMPALLERTAEGWRDPARFCFAYEELPAVPEEPSQPKMQGLPCTADQVYGLTGKPGEDARWHTDLGEFSWPKISAQKASLSHGNLIPLRRDIYINVRRLRRAVMAGHYVHLVLDNGVDHLVRLLYFDPMAWLGLPNLVHLEPRCAGLYRNVQLRDYAYELAKASEAQLRADFSTPRQLIGNVIWQAFRYGEQGIVTGYGTSHRDFWYTPLVTTLYRAGLLTRAECAWRSDSRGSQWTKARRLYALFEELLANFVARDLFFTLRQLGFADPRPDLRRIGARRPEILLVVEKDSLAEYAERLADEFGISMIILSGKPSLLASEYLAEALRGLGAVRVIAYVDFDPGGWIVGSSLADQLVRFGLALSGPVEFLVRAELFTAEEIGLYALPCKMSSAKLITETRQWLEKSGGVAGQPLALHANHLQPYERVRERVAGLL